jgi:hypothetical protein
MVVGGGAWLEEEGQGDVPLKGILSLAPSCLSLSLSLCFLAVMR